MGKGRVAGRVKACLPHATAGPSLFQREGWLPSKQVTAPADALLFLGGGHLPVTLWSGSDAGTLLPAASSATVSAETTRPIGSTKGSSELPEDT